MSLDTVQFNSLSWADGLILVSQTSDGLKNCLECLESYCDQWGLTVNVDKTQCMVMSRGYVNTDNFNFTFKGDQLEMVNTYKYLGLIVSCNGSITKKKH